MDAVSVKVSNSGAPGSLIGAIYGANIATGANYDVPLRDSGPLRNAAGSYPWRLDDDYSTVVSITNIGSQPANFIATVRYEGGEYLPQLGALAVGETAVFDLNKIRDEQIPDKDGKPLPRNAKVGQFHWSVLRGGDNVRLIGRAEMVSASKKASSSYSCPVCCPDSFGGLELNPNTFLLPTGGSTATYVDGIWIDCYNNYIGPFGYPYSVNWWCENTSVMSIANYSGNQYNISGLAAGSSLMEASTQEIYYNNDGMDCYPVSSPYYAPGDVTVAPQVTIGSLVAVGKNYTADVAVTLNPSPSDTSVTLTLSTTSGTGTAKFSDDTTSKTISQTTTVTIKGITESSAVNNIRLEAKSGSTSLATHNFTVVEVTFSLRNSGQVSNDNAAKSFYTSALGTANLGTLFSSGTITNRWRTAVEIVGTVKPSAFTG